MVVAVLDGCYTANRLMGKGSEFNNAYYEDPKKLDFYVDEKKVDAIMALENETRKKGKKAPEVILSNTHHQREGKFGKQYFIYNFHFLRRCVRDRF